MEFVIGKKYLTRGGQQAMCVKEDDDGDLHFYYYDDDNSVILNSKGQFVDDDDDENEHEEHDDDIVSEFVDKLKLKTECNWVTIQNGFDSFVVPKSVNGAFDKFAGKKTKITVEEL